jgi:hypothetical protein
MIAEGVAKKETRKVVLAGKPRDPGKSENAWFLRGRYPGGYPPFEFLKMHLYQYTQKIEHCSNKFDFLTLFCLEGLVPNSVLSGSRGSRDQTGHWPCGRASPARAARATDRASVMGLPDAQGTTSPEDSSEPFKG